MQNLRAFSEHVSERLRRNSPAGRRGEMPRLLLTAYCQDHWIDPGGYFWRAISFIENSESFDSVINLDHATEVGFAIGFFHTLVSDLPANRLKDTLEGFHITPIYLGRYLAALEKRCAPASPDTAYCMDFIDRRKEFAPILEKAKADGRLTLRIIHGDPKVSNVMIDTGTGLAVSIASLDTVKPGLVHYDIGDCCVHAAIRLEKTPASPMKSVSNLNSARRCSGAISRWLKAF